MSKRWRVIILILGVGGVVALANAARHTLVRQPLLHSDHLIFEQNYHLSATIDDDLVALAETINLGSDSHINGNVALIGSAMQLEGHIAGDLTVLGDRVEIGPNARIVGNVTLLVDEAVINGEIAGTLNMRGDDLTIDPQAGITGDIFACVDALADGRVDSRRVLPCGESDFLASTETLSTLRDPNVVIPLLNVTVGGTAMLVLFSALGSLALAGLSILAVVMFPRQISYIEEAIRLNPRHLGGKGILLILLGGGVSFALAGALAAVPALGLVIIPVYMLGGVLFVGMALTGWITITLIAGDVLVRRVSRMALPPLVIAAAGNVSLLLVWNLLALNSTTRLLGVIALILLGAVGLGATFTTRMGTKPVHRSYLVQG